MSVYKNPILKSKRFVPKDNEIDITDMNAATAELFREEVTGEGTDNDISDTIDIEELLNNPEQIKKYLTIHYSKFLKTVGATAEDIEYRGTWESTPRQVSSTIYRAHWIKYPAIGHYFDGAVSVFADKESKTDARGVGYKVLYLAQDTTTALNNTFVGTSEEEKDAGYVEDGKLLPFNVSYTDYLKIDMFDGNSSLRSRNRLYMVDVTVGGASFENITVVPATRNIPLPSLPNTSIRVDSAIKTYTHIWATTGNPPNCNVRNQHDDWNFEVWLGRTSPLSSQGMVVIKNYSSYPRLIKLLVQVDTEANL